MVAFVGTLVRDSLFILLAFCIGLGAGKFQWMPWVGELDPALPALWIFMFLVGMWVGSDDKLPQIIRSLKVSALGLPVATTVGTFVGVAMLAPFLPLALTDVLAVGAGFGYYSLSSVFIAQLKGAELGAVALLANVGREMLTLLAMPLLVRCFGPLPAIGCGGATTMDVTLPVIVRCAGSEYIFIAVIHGMALDVTVPFWVTLFCEF